MPRPVNRLRTACLRRFPLLLVSLVGCALLGTSPAWAHTELQSASPADGSSVPVAPTVVSLVFSDGLQPFGQVAVTGPDGGSVGVGEAVVAGSTVDQSVSIAEEGNYAIAYRVVSRDGHPVQGQISFTFLSAAAPSTAGAPGPESNGSPPPSSTAPGAVSVAAPGGWSTAQVVGGVGVVALIGVTFGVLRRARKGRQRSARLVGETGLGSID